MIEDISDDRGFPFGMLDPSAPVRFEIDGMQCASLDGFIESLKFEKIKDQKNITKRVGNDAKKRGIQKDNLGNQTASRKVFWQGESFNRNSKKFKDLLSRVFREMAKNPNYQAALMATEDSDFTHSKGKTNKKDTLLTKKELIENLQELRSELKAGFKQGF